MSLDLDQLSELLAGIARSQTAVIDAVERANPGWRNTHAIPLLTIAANMRSADARLLDLPSRILLRSQGRVALDTAQIRVELERALSAEPAVVTDPSAATAPQPPRVAPPRAAASAAAPVSPSPASVPPAPATPRPSAPAAAAAPRPAMPAAPVAPPRPAAPAPAAPAPAPEAPADLDFSRKS